MFNRLTQSRAQSKSNADPVPSDPPFQPEPTPTGEAPPTDFRSEETAFVPSGEVPQFIPESQDDAVSAGFSGIAEPPKDPVQPVAGMVDPQLSSDAGAADPASKPFNAVPLSPAAKRGSPPMASPRAQPAPLPRRVMDIPGARRPDQKVDEDGKKLIVGRDIKLSGEISACSRLVVEGQVEANISDAEAIEVAESGLFKGSADIAEADISGRLEGTVTARSKLTVRKGGVVVGTVRYTNLVIEEGGVVKGSLEWLGDESSPTTAS